MTESKFEQKERKIRNMLSLGCPVFWKLEDLEMIHAYAMGKVREALEMAAKIADAADMRSTSAKEQGYHPKWSTVHKIIAESIRALSAKLSSGEVKSSGEKGE